MTGLERYQRFLKYARRSVLLQSKDRRPGRTMYSILLHERRDDHKVEHEYKALIREHVCKPPICCGRAVVTHVTNLREQGRSQS